MGADLGGALLRVAKRRAPLLILELVGLVEQPVHAHVGAARHEFDEPLVGGHEGTAGVHHDDETDHVRALRDVAAHELRPGLAGVFARLGKAVARKVDEAADVLAHARLVLLRQGEEVDELGAARRLAREGEAGLARQHVDGGRLTGVGAAGKGDFRHGFGRQARELGGGDDKTSGVEDAQGNLVGEKSWSAVIVLRRARKDPRIWQESGACVRRDGADYGALPKTSLSCMDTRTKVVRMVSSLRRRAPT